MVMGAELETRAERQGAAAGRAAEARPLYSVVVTVFNEEGNIAPVLAELYPAMERLGAPFEIVYCDDSSTDGTSARLAEAQARYPRLRVVRHRDNHGKSVALWSAVEAARGDWLVMLDGDGQNDPADIEPLIAARDDAAARGGIAMVAGTRRWRQDSWSKRISSRIANRVRGAILKDHTPDTGCGLKLCRRDAYQRLPRFDHNHRFLPALIQRDGGRVIFVAVTDRPRLSGQSKYGLGNRLWTGLLDLVGVWWLMRRARNPVIEEERGP
jgi:dolichol-phosphate mannosyltransferase